MRFILVAKCILNHSSKRVDYRTTKEEQIPVDADGLLHFDAFDSLYALAHNVMEYQEAMDSIQYEESKRELTEAEEYLNKLH